MGLGHHGIEELREFDRIGLRERRDLLPQRSHFRSMSPPEASWRPERFSRNRFVHHMLLPCGTLRP
jgi:hypothetical protein